MKRIVVMLLVLTEVLIAGKKPKAPRPSSQADFAFHYHTCITVHDIHSYGHSLFAGIGVHVPGLDAIVTNNCENTVTVRLTLGFFDGTEQLETSVSYITLVPGSYRYFVNDASTILGDGTLAYIRLKSVKIIDGAVRDE